MNLYVIALLALGASDIPSFDSGQSLQPLLSADIDQVAISGGMPVDADRALAPAVPGEHWLALWPTDGGQVRLRRFRVRGEVATEHQHEVELGLDLQPPSATLYWQRDGQVVTVDRLGPALRPELRAQDRSGVQSAELLVAGRAIGAENWHQGLQSGRYRFTARLEDALHNAGEVDLGTLEVDLDPPALNLEVIDAVNGWVGKPPYRIRVSAEPDAQLSVLVDGRDSCTDTGTLSCSIKQTDFELVGVDGVGNRVSRRVALQRDQQAPQLESDPPAQQGSIRLRVGESAELRVVDPGGIAKACVRKSFGHCHQLPHRFIAKKRGRYRFAVDSRDGFGNRRKQRVLIEVTR